MKTKTLLAALAATVALAACIGGLHKTGVGGIGNPAAQAVWAETQPGTRGLPDGGCSCAPGNTSLGLCLNGVVSFHGVATCADNSNVTAGSEVGWYCDPNLNQWQPAQTYNNFTIVSGTALPDGGYAIASGPELQVTNPFGRFLYQSNGVVCSGSGWDGGVYDRILGAQQ